MAEFYTNDRIVKGENCSFVVLIPKKKNLVKILDFRPISLIGCIYKVISKTLTNRLKRVIETIILDTKMTFISGRHIVDGILIANEVVDETKSKNKEVVMFKVDFEKAHDSLIEIFLIL
jgi:hypothetical protein